MYIIPHIFTIYVKLVFNISSNKLYRLRTCSTVTNYDKRFLYKFLYIFCHLCPLQRFSFRVNNLWKSYKGYCCLGVCLSMFFLNRTCAFKALIFSSFVIVLSITSTWSIVCHSPQNNTSSVSCMVSSSCLFLAFSNFSQKIACLRKCISSFRSLYFCLVYSTSFYASDHTCAISLGSFVSSHFLVLLWANIK